MATKEQVATLLYFKWEEFRHPELCDFAFLKWLDVIRLYARTPLFLTSDARTEAENAAAGGAPTSLHLLGRAVDIRWNFNNEQLYKVLDAVCDAGQGRSVELEVVPAGAQAHVHIGLFPDDKHGSSFFVGPAA